MQQYTQQIEKSSLIWRIPFERDYPIAMEYVINHIYKIMTDENCLAVGTYNKTFFNFHNLLKDSEEYRKEDQIREKIITHNDMYPMFHCDEKIYIILGEEPYGYVTIEYNKDGLGIISNYCLLEDV